MKEIKNPNLVVLTESFKKDNVNYPVGTHGQIVGGWTGKKEDAIEMLIEIDGNIIGSTDIVKHKKLYISSYKDIVGWFDFQDVYDLAVEQAKNGDCFLEVGCFMGKSTAYLMQKIKESGKDIKVIVIDIFTAECSHHEDLIKEIGHGSLLDIFKKNMEDLGFYLGSSKNKITPVSGKSQEIYNAFLDNTFSMIFIDAAHDYESVKADLNNFYPKLKSGGIFAGHDYGEKSCGVGKAVDEFVKENNLKLDVMTASWILIKP